MKKLFLQTRPLSIAVQGGTALLASLILHGILALTLSRLPAMHKSKTHTNKFAQKPLKIKPNTSPINPVPTTQKSQPTPEQKPDVEVLDINFKASGKDNAEKLKSDPNQHKDSKKLSFFSKQDFKQSLLDKIVIKKPTPDKKANLEFSSNSEAPPMQGTKSISEMLADPKTRNFAAKINKHIYSSIKSKLDQSSSSLKSKLTQMQKNGPQSLFYIEVDRQGKIVTLKQLEQSNFPDLDHVVERGILAAEPFPPVPLSMHIEKYCISNT